MEILKTTTNLFNEIGKEFSDNHSSTLRSRLVAISRDGRTCTIEEVENWGKAPKPGLKKAATWYIDNCFYGV